MAVVIRIQGLPLVAGSSDIRRFFSGLNIPDGGVHIIGGENGEAFIIFATDEDARQAMSYSGGIIKNSRIDFFLSSKTEMQSIIEINRKRYDRGGREAGSRRMGSSGTSGVGNLSNLVAAIKKGIGKSSYDSRDRLEDQFHSSRFRNSDTNFSKSNFNQPRKEAFKIDTMYVFLRGMPYSSTEDDVFNFFSGLQMEGVRFLKNNGQNNGCGVVKFATSSDAMKALQRDRNYMGSRFIVVRPSNEGTWFKYGGRIDKKMDHSFNFEQNFNKGSYSPSREYSRREPNYLSSRKRTRSRTPPQRVVARTHSRSPSGRIMAHTYSRSPRRVMTHIDSRCSPWKDMAHTGSRSPSRRVIASMHSDSPRRVTRTRSRSPRRVKTHSHSPFSGSTQSCSPQNKEYYIHVKNLSAAVEKRDLQMFFGEPDLLTKDIAFIKPHDIEARNKHAIVAFKSERVYMSALGCHKRGLFGRQVYIFPVSKKTVLELLGSSEIKSSPERHHHAKEKNNLDSYSGPKTCVYVRNFPFDVTNVEVQKFFAGFNIDDNDIYLLFDDNGVGLGEALVKFRTEDQAREAESLNRQRFLGTEVLLRCIPEEQMQEFGINVTSVFKEKNQGHLHTCERDENSYSVDSQGSSRQGDIKESSDYRCLSDDFICSPDHFRGPTPFTEFGEGVPGNFPDGRFMPDSNFGSGSDCVTVIKLKNIPFRASHNEILDFFHGYKIIPESLSIQHNEYGMFSGEAIIALVNYKEAVAAVNELNERPIGKRKIRLSLA